MSGDAPFGGTFLLWRRHISLQPSENGGKTQPPVPLKRGNKKMLAHDFSYSHLIAAKIIFILLI